MMRTILQDLRYGARMLAKNPGFTAVAVLTLALGIGANTAIFSVVNATLLRPLPFHDPDTLMQIWTIRPSIGAEPSRTWSYPKYQTFREHQQVFEDVAVYYQNAFDLAAANDAERVIGERVSASYFSTLRVGTHLGRTFLAEEDAPPAPRVVVLGHGLWQRAFGADPGVIGKTVKLQNEIHFVVGVLRPGFRGLTGRAEIWIPVATLGAADLAQRWAHRYDMIARRKPGVTEAQAKSAVAVLGALVDDAHPNPRWPSSGARATTLDEERLDRDFRTAVLVLFGAVAFVVLIACVNVANLLLARSAARRQEIAIRLAIGASRTRIARLLLTESVLLGLLSTGAALVFAYWGVSALSAISPSGNPFGRRLGGLTIIGLSSIAIDRITLLFTFGVALLSAFLFGLAPALQASREELAATLRVRSERSRNILVAAEVALALVLLVGSGLMIKSFGRLLAVDAGIDPSNVLTWRMTLPPGEHRQLQDRIAALPGVQSVGMVDCPPLTGACSATIARFPDRPPVERGAEPWVDFHWVAGDYFKILKIPLLRGRLFTPEDREGGRKVVLISEKAARMFWPNDDPVGKQIAIGIGGFSDGAEVVGVVGNVRYHAMDRPPVPQVYVSYLQINPSQGTLLVKTTGDPLTLAPAVRQEISTLRQDVPVYDMKSMQERIGDATARMRFSATLLGVFAAIALLLAAVGIYGVTSYAVSQRTREIGVRIALGAMRGDVLALFIGRATKLIVPGIAIGLLAALGATRLLQRLLYEVKPSDPAIYLILALVFSAVALLASYIPARRAAKVDPMVALRYE